MTYRKILFIIYYLLFFLFLQCSNEANRNFNLGSIVAYPNPFKISVPNSFLRIKLAHQLLPLPGETKLQIFDENRNLVFEKNLPGDKVEWSGATNDGTLTPPGVYFVYVIVTNQEGSIGKADTRILVQ